MRGRQADERDDRRRPPHPAGAGRQPGLPPAYADGRSTRPTAGCASNEPFGVAKVEGIDPFWVATKHADILEISRQNDLFHSGDRSPTLTTQVMDKKVREMMGGSPHLLRTLGPDGRPGSPEVPGAHPGLVHAAEPARAWRIASARSPAPPSTRWPRWAASATS
jgi:hypothetical protein